MKQLHEWMDEYGESHQNKINKLIHWICVPIIMLSLIGILSKVSISSHAIAISLGSGELISQYATLFLPLDLGNIIIVIAFIYYLRMSVPMAAGMFVIGIVIRLICAIISSTFITNDIYIYISIFFIAWIGQFIGHKIEGKKPSFIKDIQFLLIGPAWLLSYIYQKFGVRY